MPVPRDICDILSRLMVDELQRRTGEISFQERIIKHRMEGSSKSKESVLSDLKRTDRLKMEIVRITEANIVWLKEYPETASLSDDDAMDACARLLRQRFGLSDPDGLPHLQYTPR